MKLCGVQELLLICLTVSVTINVTKAFLVCRPHEFQCFNGKCIEQRYFCPNYGDYCGDNSEKEYCNIYPEEECPVQGMMPWKRCKNKTRCYPITARCNDFKDCTDGSDEEGCIHKMTGVRAAQKRLVRRLLEVRHSSSLNKWNENLLKATVALYLTDPYFFASYNKTGEEMRYEVSQLLLAKLSLKEEIPEHELSLFVNALMVSCINPREFYGLNLVSELRKRADNSSYVNPFTILTLCNAGDTMKAADFTKVVTAFYAYHLRPWADTQALAAMALGCLLTRSKLHIDDSSLPAMTDVLKQKQNRNGIVENLKTTALVAQALLATDSHHTGFNMSAAIKILVDGVSKTSLEDAYHILPLLSTKSLMDLNSGLCVSFYKSDLDIYRKLLETHEAKIEVVLSTFAGKERDLLRTWKLKVPVNYTLHDLLERIGIRDPEYKAQYSVVDGKPYVSQIGKFVNDPVAGMFWFTYTRSTHTPPLPGQNLLITSSSPADIPVRKNVELILWYRPGIWNTNRSKNDANLQIQTTDATSDSSA